MITEQEILEMLRNGTRVEEIADTISNRLNSANTTYKAECKAEAQRKEEARTKEVYKAKIAAMDDILDAIYEYIDNFYCETDEDVNTLRDIFKDVDAEDIVNQIEELGAIVFGMKDMIDGLFNKETKNKVGPQSKEDCDAIINSFLKSIGV